MKAIVLAVGVSCVSPAMAEIDVFIRAVGFALTGSDNTEPKALDRKNCVFQIGEGTYRLNNVQTDRLLFKRGYSPIYGS
jgi:hypothetical protein